MPIAVYDLRCEYRRDPLGVDCRPRLSWRLDAARRGARQVCYQIQVASSLPRLARADIDRWDSGRVESNRQNQIDYEGPQPVSRQRCVWRVRVWDESGDVSPWSEPATWSFGLLQPGDWSASWIGVSEPDPPTGWPTPRCLRRAFELDEAVTHATVNVTALGLYELRLNGAKVGDHVLAPEWTNYHRRVQYQTLDVTAMLRPGANTIAAVLGNGWYCGGWQHWESTLRPIYGSEPWLLAQLEIETAGGRTTRVVTDASWQGTTDGPLRFAGVYEGETYDATRESAGWDRGADSDTKWNWRTVTVAAPRVGRRVWQRSEPIRVTREIAPIAVTQPRPGTYVFDLGQNIAGWCRLQLREPRGTLVTLRHNEMLNPDGTVYADNLHAGHLSGGDRQVVRYVCGGGEETYEPRFTYQGFRYVEVTGLTTPPILETIVGRVVHSDIEPAGRFECSEPLLNRLVENIAWSQRANFMGVPTDCPQRDERCGYTGDANFFIDTAVYLFDIAAFLNKWMVDVCQDSQRPDGGFADHAPDYGKGSSQNVGWADAGVTCIYRAFRAYGDTRVVREHYPAIKRFLAMLVETSHGDTRGPEHVGLGDWLNLGGGASKEVIGTAYYAHCFALAAEMAEAIGESADADAFARRAEAVRAAFARELIDAEGRIKESSQTGYALAFSMDLIPPEMSAEASRRFAQEIERFDGKLATGFIGTPRLLPGLHAAGRADLAGRLLLERRMPSWLFPVEHGATTIWERWDGWTPESGFADSGMNSFNHYAFGSVGEYLFRCVAGIAELEPGYRTVAIRPTVGYGLTRARASYRSIHGTIRVEWQRCDGELRLTVELPANTRGEITLPCGPDDRIFESGVALECVADVSHVRRDGARTALSVGSGRYAFSVRGP